SVGGVCYRGANGSNASGSNCSGVPASNRHSVGPIWGQAASRNSFESLKGAPAPPRRSDSYAAIRNHERPNSWSSLDHARSLRTLSSQERSDPRDKSRYSTGTSCCWIYWIFSCKSFILMSFFSSFRQRDQPSVHSELPGSSRVAQGQVLPTAGPTSIPQPSARHFSDSAAPQYQSGNHRESDKDSEHPLTRLEIALAEVQRCASPNTQDTSNTHSPARSLSVLEKVSHFERRKAGGKQRSYSTNSYSKAFHLGMTDKGRSFPCGTEDLRNMLERSTKGTKPHRTMSYRGGSNEYMKHRTPADPISALQRSRSSFHLDGSKYGDISKNFPWRHELQEIMDPLEDTTSNRSYRDSVKDAQPHVLRSTSFTLKELSSSVSSPPSGVPLPVNSSSSPQAFPVSAKYNSLEKKGPKTKPKPQGVVITQQPPATSPHTPKERHVVSPDNGCQSPPPLPSVPPVGPPPLTRICGRKRLTADQKKRSYSEPENMNEVGVSDPETTALFRRRGGIKTSVKLLLHWCVFHCLIYSGLPETSVADRRKMFELASSHVGAPQSAMSRSDMRQVRQDALVEYVERKRGVRREEGGHRSGSRPRSAYLQPEQGYQTEAKTSRLLSLNTSLDCLRSSTRLCRGLGRFTGLAGRPLLRISWSVWKSNTHLNTFALAHPQLQRNSTRERQRSVERLGAYSTSTLAASVGLPFPFSPAGNQQDSGAAEWEANERLSQANLDAITFSEIQQTSDGESRMNAAGGNSDRQTRHNTINNSIPIRKSSVQCSLPLKPQPSSSIATSTAAEDVLVFEYQPLPKREKTLEELRVEALACQLVRSSTPRSFQT
ncbi:hypothetical protein GOODEAATRI_003227, partial [Goodea atripinnis]